MGLLSLIFSIISLKKESAKGMAIAGLILGMIGILISILIFIMIISLLPTIMNGIEQIKTMQQLIPK